MNIMAAGGDASRAPACHEDNGDDRDECDSALMRNLLRQAAVDPDQPSLDDWLISSFSSEAVEDAYQAGQAPVRASGIVVASILSIVWGYVLNDLGNAPQVVATWMERTLRFSFVNRVAYTLFVLPFLFYMMQAWNPIKHRKLVNTTCICLVILNTIVTTVTLPPFSSVTEGNIFFDAAASLAGMFWALMTPFFVIVLFRPSILLISPMSFSSAFQFGIMGYYSQTFDTVGLALGAGIYFLMTMQVIAYFGERSNRVSFVHHILQEQLQTVVAQAKSEQAEAAAQALNKQNAYQKVVAATAHDLRTAASALQSGCRVLTMIASKSEKPGADPLKLLHSIGPVVESMSAMAKFSSMFLQGMTLSARILDGSSIPVHIEKIDIQQILDESITCGKLACSGSVHVELRSEIDPAIGEFMFSDVNCISRNLINLISNGSKHTFEGSIVVKASLQASSPQSFSQEQPTYIEIAVRDTGTGVADENKSRIFEPFVSMDQSTGLGLFVVHSQSEVLGGSCGVRDNPEGRGAEFWFRVPHFTTEQELQEYSACMPKICEHNPGDTSVETEGITVFQDEIQVNAQIAVRTVQGANVNVLGTVLLIDDNYSLLQLHAAELSAAGYKVSTAQGGTQGLACLKLKPYSLVMIDIMMPCIDGDEVVAAFRHWESNNRTGKLQTIYALSAYTNAGVQKRCQVVGMAGVLAKPLRIEIVEELLRKALQAV
jgi:signal transduction histidine kinase/ActR/RegA family two-component response regulator